MHLVKELRTANLLIQVYSLNPNLIVGEDSSIFEGKDDSQIKDIVFNQMGAEEVRISEGDGGNSRSYAIA